LFRLQAGAELADVILILNTDEAVNAFRVSSSISLGADVGASLGPLGRSVGADLSVSNQGNSASVFYYAHSKGLFLGVSLEAAGVICRPDLNREYYGKTVSPADLLSEAFPRPRGAEPLYRALSEVLFSVEPERGGERLTGVPSQEHLDEFGLAEPRSVSSSVTSSEYYFKHQIKTFKNVSRVENFKDGYGKIKDKCDNSEIANLIVAPSDSIAPSSSIVPSDSKCDDYMTAVAQGQCLSSSSQIRSRAESRTYEEIHL